MTKEETMQERDKADEEVDKIDKLAKRIEEYKEGTSQVISEYVAAHNDWLDKINQTGYLHPDNDPVLLGPMVLAKIEIWYSFARKEAYSIAGKCRDLHRFYLAVAEQGKSNQFEKVRKNGSATDAKEMARRVGGRLEEKGAYWEGEYLRWTGIADSYEQTGNGVKDLYKLAEFEYTRMKGRGN